MSTLLEAAKAFYNATVADHRVVIRAFDDESRDRIQLLGEALREHLVDASGITGGRGRDDAMAQAGATCLEFGFYGSNKPPEGHWLMPYWLRGRVLAQHKAPADSTEGSTASNSNGTAE